MRNRILPLLLFVLCLFIGSGSAFAASDSKCGTPDASYTFTYLMVFDTKAAAYARSQSGTLEAHAQKGIDKCNEVVRNSNIDCYFKLSGCMELTDLTWTDSSSSGMIAAGPKISERSDVFKRWEESGATICAVVLYPGGNTLSGNFNASPMTWDVCRGVIDASALSNTYTLIHETGHIFGCMHDDVFTMEYHDYALGYVGSKYYTVMSYGHMGQNLQMVPYFSGPDQVYNGVTLGDAHHNCARMVRENLPLIDKLSKRQAFIDVKEQTQTASGTITSELTNNTKAVGPAKSTFTLSITSPDFLTFSTTASWLHLSSTASGISFTTVIYIDVDAYSSGAPREGKIRIASTTDPNNYVDIIVTQNSQGGGGGTVTPTDKVLVSSVTVSPDEVKIPVGGTYQLQGIVMPADATNATLKWWSGNDLVASVSSTGLVTAKTEGETMIYADSTDGTNLGGYTFVTVTKGSITPVDPGKKTCATPVISLEDGMLAITCETPGATIQYTLTMAAFTLTGQDVTKLPSDLAARRLTLEAKATAKDYVDSEVASRTFTLGALLSLLTTPGDVNADGVQNIADVVRLVDQILKKK